MTKLNESTPVEYRGRPRFEGANISTFIGFKHFMFLAEDAVLDAFRQADLGPQRLFEQYGLGLEIVDSSVRLTATLHTDDVVVGTVVALPPKADRNGITFRVQLAAEGGGDRRPVLNGKLTVAVVAEKDGAGTEPVPDSLRPFVVSETAGVVAAVTDAGPAPLTHPDNGFVWSWKIPYFYCHYYTRIQSSGYVRLLEDAVDRYLEHAHLSITELLAHRDWIPVVSRARVQLLADAYMGETLHITFEVDDIIKETVFTARMQCYVERAGRIVRVATATIMHGYVLARGLRAFEELQSLDAETQRRLLGGRS